MLRRVDQGKMGGGDEGWLKTKFHFSFADYYNPANISFGVLRVVNDDLVAPGYGFETHPHRDMEIISYVIDGELTHADSMGNQSTLSRGHVQYMSAGTGVEHSEFNHGSVTLRLLQIWIFPDKKGLKPNYGEQRFNWDDRNGQWLHIVSGKGGGAPISINQDANIYVLALAKDREIGFPVASGRQAYLVQIEGASDINGIELGMRDALEITEEDIRIRTRDNAHFLVIEMKVGAKP